MSPSWDINPLVWADDREVSFIYPLNKDARISAYKPYKFILRNIPIESA